MQDVIFGLFIPVISLVYAAGFFLLWLRARDRRYILGLGISNLTVGTAFSWMLFGSPDFAFPGMLVPEILFFASGIVTMWAICDRVGRPVPLKIFVLISIVGMAMGSVANVHGQIMIQHLIGNSAHGLIVVLGVYSLSQSTARSVLDRSIVWLFGLHALDMLVRPPLAMIADGGLTAQNFAESTYVASLIVSTSLLIVLGSTTLIVTVLLDQFRVREEESVVDHLTGLKSRRPFEEAAVEMLDEAFTRRIPVSLIVADIDHFKQVNDLWGHQAGDRAIAAFGKKIQAMIRDVDLGGRIGGEEFCIIAWNCELEAAKGLAERIRQSFAKLQHEGINPDIRLTASFGVSVWEPGEGYGKLFARADAALYRAKDSGRNAVRTANALQRRETDRKAAEDDPSIRQLAS